jgi:hypothetical protein
MSRATLRAELRRMRVADADIAALCLNQTAGRSDRTETLDELEASRVYFNAQALAWHPTWLRRLREVVGNG